MVKCGLIWQKVRPQRPKVKLFKVYNPNFLDELQRPQLQALFKIPACCCPRFVFPPSVVLLLRQGETVTVFALKENRLLMTEFEWQDS